MKKLLLMMGILLSAGMFFACSSDDEMNVNGGDGSTLIPDDGVVLSPVTLHDEKGFVATYEDGLIVDFFDLQLPIGKRSKGFFVDSDKNECYVINSLDELANIYKGDIPIPEIDFEKYTLVIGQEVMPDFYYPVYKQDIMFSDHKCHLTLYVPDFDFNPGYKPLQQFYYWSLYPKFSTEGISVGFIKEKSVLKSIEDATAYVWINPFKTGCVGSDQYSNWAKYSSLSDPYDGYLIYHETTTDGNYHYLPINLPEDFVVDKVNGTNVNFSGNIIEMTFDPQSMLRIPNTGDFMYFIYLTNIEITD